MKYFLSFFIVLSSIHLCLAQIILEDLYSEKLEQNRKIKIMLPKGYSETDDKAYPIVLVLDADYMFELVTGNTDYYSYWEEMPEVIVVGINQAETRNYDTVYSDEHSLPVETGGSFFEFIGREVVPYIQNKYKTIPFKVIIGHGKTANFINYFLLKEQPFFSAYISLSPDLAPDMANYLNERLQNTKFKIFYYLATSDNDVPYINNSTLGLDEKLNQINNPNLYYNFENFEGPSHYMLPTSAIPKALQNVFRVYQPISKKEFNETIIKLEGSPVEYLIEKYKTISDLYGLNKQILMIDFEAIAVAIEKTKNYEYFQALSKLAKKVYPKTLLGHYYLARFYEQTGEPKRAMRAYQAAYGLDEIGGFTKDGMLEKADAIKADFGY